ncbi:hypothetical protein MLD38_039888 [Melastoma candidum]|uniref:Uncharacterized protein n=1 Tax=Melastoma candidum TaxID=119954 RepID=A0ACB9L3Y9_9MYRT|nr:hypothetical protein MLD38_039888 [Melastoma candidum]
MMKSTMSLVLRLLALVSTAVAVAIMLKSHDSTLVLGITFDAKYSHSPALQYFVIAEGIGGIYSLVSLLLSRWTSSRHFVYLMDVVVAMLLSSSVSAALAIAYVGKKGESHAGWLPICKQVPRFCNEATGSLAAGFLAALLYMVLVLCCIRSLYALKP